MDGVPHAQLPDETVRYRRFLSRGLGWKICVTIRHETPQSWAVHDSDIKSRTVTPEGFDLPRALRLSLLGNGADEDVAYGAQLEEALKEEQNISTRKNQNQKPSSPQAFVLASSSGSWSRGSVSTGSNPGMIGYFGTARGLIRRIGNTDQ